MAINSTPIISVGPLLIRRALRAIDGLKPLLRNNQMDSLDLIMSTLAMDDRIKQRAERWYINHCGKQSRENVRASTQSSAAVSG